MTLSLPVAFLAGLVTFFSPCVIPVVPGYLAVLTGGERGLALRRVIIFSLGLALTFSTLGVLVGFVGSFIAPVKDILMRVVGLALLLFGLNLVWPMPLGIFSKQWRISISSSSTDLTAFGLGATFGLAWIPCAGIILGAILAQALLFQTASAAVLLLSYSLGLILPMVGIALIYERSGRVLRIPPRVSHYLTLVTGIVIGIFGLALLLGWVVGWQSSILNHFPDWEKTVLNFTR